MDYSRCFEVPTHRKPCSGGGRQAYSHGMSEVSVGAAGVPPLAQHPLVVPETPASPSTAPGRPQATRRQCVCPPAPAPTWGNGGSVSVHKGRGRTGGGGGGMGRLSEGSRPQPCLSLHLLPVAVAPTLCCCRTPGATAGASELGAAAAARLPSSPSTSHRRHGAWPLRCSLIRRTRSPDGRWISTYVCAPAFLTSRHVVTAVRKGGALLCATVRPLQM